MHSTICCSTLSHTRVLPGSSPTPIRPAILLGTTLENLNTSASIMRCSQRICMLLEHAYDNEVLQLHYPVKRRT